MTKIAIIPARGGSKRIPQKNIHPFFGHPMLAYTIAAALNSRLFDQVIVSSDDLQIGAIAGWYGATFLQRPESLASDTASLVDVALHVLESFHITEGELCQLMPNCPLRRSDDIVEHYEAMLSKERKFQISATAYRGVYPFWAMHTDDEGHGRWVFGREYLVRSQELQETICPTGAIWWADIGAFFDQRAFYGEGFAIMPMDANRGIDIDNMEDLALAEVLVLGLRAQTNDRVLESIHKEPFSL